MTSKLAELYSYRDFVKQLIVQLLRLRYQGSILGFFWTLAYPILLFAVYTVVFSVLNHWEIRDFGVYFFSGFIVWNFFANTSQHAAESIVGNASLITRIYVPKAAFPLASLVLHLIDLAASLVILFALMALFGTHFSAALLVLPFSIAIITVFVMGVGFISASVNVFFRDFRHLNVAVLSMWFFFSPILWKPALLPPDVRRFAALNPITPFISLLQVPIWEGRMPEPHTWLFSAVGAVAVLAAGFLSFCRSEDRFYFYL